MTRFRCPSTTQGHDRALCVVPAPPQVDLTAVIGASTGLFGAIWAQAELRKVLPSIGAKVVDRELALAQAHR
jgi:NAD(P)H-dependent FMN reductase